MINVNQGFAFVKKNPDIIYLDSSSTTLVHNSVVEALELYTEELSVGLGKSSGRIGNRLSDIVGYTRIKLRQFYNCPSVAFSFSATDSLNLIANILKTNYRIKKVALGIDNHHASLLPFYSFDKVFLGLDSNLNLDFSKVDKTVDLLVITLCSNVLGNSIDFDKIRELKTKYPKLIVIVDATQYLSFAQLDFEALGVDFVIGSFHKMYGPLGLGLIMYQERYQKLLPSRVGGGIVESVTTEDVKYYSDGRQLEAGTLNVAGILAIPKLLDFLERYVYFSKPLDFSALYALEDYKSISSKDSSKIVTFRHIRESSFDVASFLAVKGFIVRSGLMCAEPLFDYLGLSDCVRASFGVYNDQKDVDRLLEALKEFV